MYIISACLLGYRVRYDGESNLCAWIQTWVQGRSIFPCCPEMEGGLLCPRPPAELRGQAVMNNLGEDVTGAFIEGAKRVIKTAMAEAKTRGETIEGAILKARSPSCGKDIIYDGSFTGKKVSGSGVFAKMLINEGIPVFSEEDGSEFNGGNKE